MTDVLIRGLSPRDVASIDQRAARLGLSRNEYLRRRIVQDVKRAETHVTAADLHRASELARDLLEDGLLRDAWS